MSQVPITNRLLSSLKPKSSPYFVRDIKLKGFAVKVNPSGIIKYIVEVRREGKTSRKTIGDYPTLNLKKAKRTATSHINNIKSGLVHVAKNEKLLAELFEEYISGGRLKERTVTDYQEAVYFYLSDWLNKPITWISKERVEKRFYLIRDRGINGGKPTYSQATKVMRILSALMNYAMADDLIESNPVDVLKRKRIERSMLKRKHYLPANIVQDLLHQTSSDCHPVTLAVHLMLYTGLRKNEALRLKWADIKDVNGITCVVVGDTKNHRAHYVPITSVMSSID